MAELTKVRLQQIVHAAGLEPCDYEEVFDGITTGEIVMMARQLLASMEQEPAIEVSEGDVLSEIFTPGTKLYAAPQLPHPAVPDEAEMPSGPGVPEYNVGWANGWNSCREEMLQGAEQQNRQQNIPENIPTLRDGLAAIRNSGIAIDAERIQAERDALNEPEQGWIACSERMPLSPEEGCEYWDVEVQAFDGERVLIAHYAIGSKPKPWGAWVDTHAEITHWQPLAEAPQQDK